MDRACAPGRPGVTLRVQPATEIMAARPNAEPGKAGTGELQLPLAQGPRAHKEQGAAHHAQTLPRKRRSSSATPNEAEIRRSAKNPRGRPRRSLKHKGDFRLASGFGLFPWPQESPRLDSRFGGAGQGAAMRVLLVEDDYPTAQAMELMMRSHGLNVYMTDLGEEAIELVVKWYHYDVLLLDICLPDMSGYEVLRSWRANGVTTPVLVVTGSPDMEAKAYECGADGFYAKPNCFRALVPGIFAAVRKASGNPALVTIGRLRVDTAAKRAMMGKAPLFLTDDEYRALELMALRRGCSVDIPELYAYLFAGVRAEGRGERIEEAMRTLMLKLRLASGGRDYIRAGWPGIYCWANDLERG
jgi:two-component system cell cycle response regulator CtrA